ncbi:ABC transporter ATP-binding protein [Arthrobacter zhaoguopingii]|uniref:ABC transporter ATP-binding protein n=1 Tax=Arthrobacter zhaoguopingii TaxID=2681491 RepID=UPI001359DD05|nr:ABC transporter ATP-binding protein [Arthrobacter zhaoguopingii]
MSADLSTQSPSPAPAVQVDGLGRTFGSGPNRKVALDRVNLTVKVGEIHGLLGPNGAGKSTLSRILSTIIVPTSGTARVMGHNVATDPSAVRRSIALVLGGDRGLYGRLTPQENLEFWCVANGVRGRRRAQERAKQALERVGLAGVDRRVESFSRGMKQRVHLARALAVEPDVLILDEPTMGLDPVAALALRRLVLDARAAGSTVLLATHDMAEAQAICDRVSLLDAGRIGFSATPAELRRQSGGARVRFDEPLPSGVLQQVHVALSRLDGGLQVTEENGTTTITVPQPQQMAGVLNAVLATGTTAFAVMPPSLEDVYLAAVGDRGLHVD